MGSRKLVLCLVVPVILVATTAQAEPVYISSFTARQVYLKIGDLTLVNATDRSTDPLAFSYLTTSPAAGSVSQLSTITATGIDAIGAVALDNGGDMSQVMSTISVMFSLDTPHVFSLTASSLGVGRSEDILRLTRYPDRLTDPTLVIVDHDVFGNDEFALARQGLLEPGTYQFAAGVGVYEGTGSFATNLRLTAAQTPEPASMLLVGAGLIMLARRAKRSRIDI